MPLTPRQLHALRLVMAAILILLTVLYLRNPAGVDDPLPADGPLAARLPARIDPNTADAPTLAAIPGLTQTLAQRIIEFRTLHSPTTPTQPVFRTPDDLRQIKGIGPATLQNITPYLLFPTDNP